MENTKLCPRCSQTRPLTDYHFNQKQSKYAYYCKKCVSDKAQIYHQSLSQSNDPNDILKSTFTKMLQSTRSNAKSKSLPCSINLSILTGMYHKQEGKCYYTGTPMTLRTSDHLNRDPLLISLDRIQPNEGYTPSNTVMCCWGVNAMKGHHSKDLFYQTLKLFYENSITKGIFWCLYSVNQSSFSSSNE